MMCPCCCSRMMGMAARITRNGPTRLVFQIFGEPVVIGFFKAASSP